jgi:P4 family phage/plasmid primase-like protien
MTATVSLLADIDAATKASYPPHLKRFFELLSPVVILPVTPGEKGPHIKGWNKFDMEKMRDRAYVRKFWRMCNVGVLLGSASSGLCSIDIDGDEFVSPFLDANPRLRETFRTARGRGCNLWVRIKGDCPATEPITTVTDTPWGEWRSEASCTMIYGWALDKTPPNTRRDYRILVENQPIEIEFAEINWTGLKATWVRTPFDDLVEAYGDPYYLNRSGMRLNQSFWAGLYATEKKVVHEPNEKRFSQYNTEEGIYEAITEDSIRTWLSKRILEASREVGREQLATKRDSSDLSGVISHLRGTVEQRDVFKKNNTFVHLANGVVKFDGREASFFHSHPSFLSRNKSPIRFDPEALCPRFLNGLLLPALSAEDIELLQKYLGMLLSGMNFLQRMLLIEGLAGSGKTQLALIIQCIIGKHNCAELRTQHLTSRFELSRYIDKTLLVGVDVPPDFLNREGATILKGLVGGDAMDAEMKNGNGNFPITGDFGVIVTSNTRLKVRLQGDIGAWRRRIIALNFKNYTPPRKIPNFASVLLQEEGSGIVNWGLMGLQKLFNDIQETGDIRLPNSQTKRVEDLLAESESVRHFLVDCIQQEDGHHLINEQLLEKYAEYCQGRSWIPQPTTTFYQQLDDLMLELFHASKSHSISNEFGYQMKGYRNVGFKCLI